MTHPSSNFPNQENDRLYSIAELSQEFDLSPRALRFYESKGLITPQRVGATRVYFKRDHARLSLIKRGKRLGFSLDEIAEYLALYDSEFGLKAQIPHLIEKVTDRISALRAQRTDIETTIKELKDILRRAEEFINPKINEKR